MRLLVVDDEAPVVDVLKAFLESSDSDVVGLTNSQEAAEWVEREKFDGIFLDVRMPGLDGFELTRRVRTSSLNSTTPVVMLTGLDDVDTMRQAFKVGATGFLGKPLTRDRVRSVVSAMRGIIFSEQRHNARLPLRAKVACVGGNCQEKRFVAETLNIGEGGLLLQSPVGLAVGEEVLLHFQLPSSDRPLRLRGRVLRQEPSDRVAIEFVGSSIGDLEAIRDYIVWRLQG
jgi:DNA-binding response OmpR family regulator